MTNESDEDDADFEFDENISQVNPHIRARNFEHG